jgi:hypothetical protein
MPGVNHVIKTPSVPNDGIPYLLYPSRRLLFGASRHDAPEPLPAGSAPPDATSDWIRS